MNIINFKNVIDNMDNLTFLLDNVKHNKISVYNAFLTLIDIFEEFDIKIDHVYKKYDPELFKKMNDIYLKKLDDVSKLEFRSFIKDITCNLKQINDLTLNYKLNELSKDEIIKYSLEFCDFFDPTFLKYAEVCLKNNLFFKNSNDLNAYSYYEPYFEKAYIIIQTNKINFYTLDCMVHELGHMYHFHQYRKNKNKFMELPYNIFGEVPAYEFELMFFKFLDNKFVNEINHMYKVQINYAKKMANYLYVINYVIDELKTGEIYCDEIQEKLKSFNIFLSEDEIEKYLTDALACYQYVFAFIISYSLDYMPLKEQVKLTKKFVNDMGYNTSMDLFRKYNIDINLINKGVNDKLKKLKVTLLK